MYLATVAGLLHQEGGRIRDWADHARHRLRCARRSIWRPAGARTRQEETIHPAPDPRHPGTPPPSSPTTRRTTELALRAGRTRACWAGARAEAGGRHPQGTRGPIRWPTTTRSKTIRDTAPSGRARYTRSETAPPRPEAQDTRRGRPGAPSSKTSSLRHRLQDPPRHARQLKHRRQPCRAQRHLSQ